MLLNCNNFEQQILFLDMTHAHGGLARGSASGGRHSRTPADAVPTGFLLPQERKRKVRKALLVGNKCFAPQTDWPGFVKWLHWDTRRQGSTILPFSKLSRLNYIKLLKSTLKVNKKLIKEWHHLYLNYDLRETQVQKCLEPRPKKSANELLSSDSYVMWLGLAEVKSVLVLAGEDISARRFPFKIVSFCTFKFSRCSNFLETNINKESYLTS